MNTSESLNGTQELEGRAGTKADLLNRAIARVIDFLIVVALYELIPAVGYFAGLTYLFIADGLFQGRSAGKRLIGLKVIVMDDQGHTINCGFRESVIRNSPFAAGFLLVGVLSAIPLIGWLLSFLVACAILLFEGLVILGSEEGMRLGDELAKTRVVDDSQGGLNV